MTLPTLYEKLFTLEALREDLYTKCRGDKKIYYSQGQRRAFYHLWRKTVRQIKQIKKDIQTHPNYDPVQHRANGPANRGNSL